MISAAKVTGKRKNSLTQADTHIATFERFRWNIPKKYNIATDVCDFWAKKNKDKPALICLHDDGRQHSYSFSGLSRISCQLAHLLAEVGFGRRMRLGILLPQSPEAALSHLAAYRMGAIALPLSIFLGEQSLLYRLKASSTRAIIIEKDSLPKLLAIKDQLPDLRSIIVVQTDRAALPPGCLDFWEGLRAMPGTYEAADTLSDDPALLIFTSGTTGHPKGALHAHRIALAHLPALELSHDFTPQEGDLFWTPSDWALGNGMLNIVLPAWHHSLPVLSYNMRKFNADIALEVMAQFQVRNVFLPPSALRALQKLPFDQIRQSDVKLRTLVSGGEALDTALLEWGRKAFGLDIAEIYGQTECNAVLGNNPNLFPLKPGSMGKKIPGHHVAIIDDQGREVKAGLTGHIAVKRPDPALFLEYWRDPDGTAEKYIDNWLLTGDRGVMDQDGYFYFGGREDDIIICAGQRMGPTEIEYCLMSHPKVALAAVIGVPDPDHGQIVKAFIQLEPDHVANPELTKELQDYVKQALEEHQYPRLIDYVQSLPMTSNGKIMRRLLREA